MAPQANWEERVAGRRQEILQAKDYVPPEEPTRIIANRAKRLHESGLTYEQAIELAGRRGDNGDFQVDVTEFEKQVRRGCPPATAARMLG